MNLVTNLFASSSDQPNSNVIHPEQVVSLTEEAQLVGFISPPLRYDEKTGLPIYPKDREAMERELAEVKKLERYSGDPNKEAVYVINESEVESKRKEIIDRHHGIQPSIAPN